MEEIQENEIRAKILPEAGSGEVFGNRQGGDNRQSDGGKKNYKYIWRKNTAGAS